MFAWLKRLRSEDDWLGADEEYATELHHIVEDFRAEDDTARLVESIAFAYQLDPGQDWQIIKEVIDLRRSMAERIEHARGRWDRIVEPLRLALLQEAQPHA